VLGAIDKPPCEFSSIEDVFKKTLQHEQAVTARINKIYALASKLNDNASTIFLQWFVNEQVEEEKNPTEILAKLKYVKDQPAGILILDKELAARIPPTLGQAPGQ